jgi:hypothetical protein
MFWSQFGLSRMITGMVVTGFLLAATPMALAQTASPVTPPSVTIHSVTVYGQEPAAQAKTDAILAALSSEAGVPYLRPSKALAGLPAILENDQQTVPPLCVRAGVGLSLPMMAGPQMIVEHGLIGCPTNTGGLPVIVTQDPALQPPPTSRTGDYNLDVTVRYRLLQLRRMQIIASVSEQGVAYSVDTPVSGNNLLLAMSVIF